MKTAITSTLLAAAVLGGGVVGTTALAGATGASDGEPTLAEEVVDTTAIDEVVDTSDDGGIVNVQDADTDEAPEADAERDGDCERRGHRGGRSLGTVAEVLGLEADELRSQLADGATIADIAGDDIDAVIDALVAEKTDRIAQAVEDGRLTQEEADEKLAEVEDRVTDKVNGIRPERGAEADDDGEISS